MTTTDVIVAAVAGLVAALVVQALWEHVYRRRLAPLRSEVTLWGRIAREPGEKGQKEPARLFVEYGVRNHHDTVFARVEVEPGGAVLRVYAPEEDADEEGRNNGAGEPRETAEDVLRDRFGVLVGEMSLFDRGAKVPRESHAQEALSLDLPPGWDLPLALEAEVTYRWSGRVQRRRVLIPAEHDPTPRSPYGPARDGVAGSSYEVFPERG